MEDRIVLPIIISIIISFFIASIGENRKIGFGKSFIACLFLSPIIGLIITLLSEKKAFLKEQKNIENLHQQEIISDDEYKEKIENITRKRSEHEKEKKEIINNKLIEKRAGPLLKQIEKSKNLGILTSEEYEEKKAEIISKTKIDILEEEKVGALLKIDLESKESVYIESDYYRLKENSLVYDKNKTPLSDGVYKTLEQQFNIVNGKISEIYYRQFYDVKKIGEIEILQRDINSPQNNDVVMINGNTINDGKYRINWVEMITTKKGYIIKRTLF